MDTTWKIVFKGELLSGFELPAVMDEMSKIMKLTDEQARKLFSGREITLKKGLSQSDGERYTHSFEKRGLKVSLLSEQAALEASFGGLSLEPVAEKPKANPKPAPEQAYSNSNGLSFAGAQTNAGGSGFGNNNNASHQADSQARPQTDANFNQSYYDTPDSQDGEVDFADQVVEAPGFFEFSGDGRYGRLNYANATAAWFGTYLAAILLTMIIGPFALLLFIAIIIWSFRYMVLRLHDLDWSGWWCLLAFVPVANLVLGLLLWFMPGTNGGNSYGPPSEQGHPVGAVLAVVFFLLILFVSL